MREIFERRSVRKFTEEPVSPQDLEKLLQAAMHAPSAGNEQPWDFLVIENRETMEKIMEFHIYSTPLKTAPMAIVVCGDESKQKYKDYWIQDCSAATQNLLLEAVHLGLGAVWMGVFPMEDRVKAAKELFQLPESVIPLGIIALGHPVNVTGAENKTVEGRFKEERIHRETW